MESFFTEKKKWWIIFILFFLGTFLITFNFTITPKVWVDEGVYTETARNFAKNGVLGLQTEPGKYFGINHLLSTGYPVILPVSGSFLTFGTGIWQARLPMIIYMVILMSLFYLFVNRKYGFLPAILSVLFLLSFSPFYGNGRPVQGEVPGLVFLLLGALLFLYWEEGGFKSYKFAFLGGLAFGLAASTKPIYMLGLFAVLFFTLIIWFKKFDKKALALSFTGFLIPMFFWFLIQFPDTASFLKIPSLYLHIASDNASTVPLIDKFTTNFLKFFTESTPALFLLTLLIVGLYFISPFITRFFPKIFGDGEVHEKRFFSISEFILLSFVLVNWVGFMFGTGWYRYFFPANTLIYIFLPASILGLSMLVRNSLAKKFILSILAFLLIFQFIHLAFYSDTAFTNISTKNSNIASILNSIDPSKKVFFYRATDAIVFFKGDNYSQYLLMGDFLDTGNKDAWKDGTYDYIFTGGDAPPELSLPCYDRKLIGGYSLIQKMDNCKTR